MTKAITYFLSALFTLGVGIYSITSIHKISQPFIEMTISSAEATRDLLANEKNIIHSITPEQRKVWLDNVSDPEIEATGIIVVANLASFIIGVLFIGYVLQLLATSYKSYNKAKQRTP